jgi:hypothetical protein
VRLNLPIFFDQWIKMVDNGRSFLCGFWCIHSYAIGYAKFRSRSDHAVIRVYDDAGNVIQTHEHDGEFRQP